MHVLILDQWKSCVQEASINVIGDGARGCCEVNRVAWVQSVDSERNPGRPHVQHAYSVACVVFRWQDIIGRQPCLLRHCKIYRRRELIRETM